MTTPETRRPLDRRVLGILYSWGAAVLILSTLLSFWIWTNQQHAAEQRERLRTQQDQAMCALIDVFLTGPEPVPGPAGDRSRSVRAGMLNYQAVLQCR